MADTKQVKTGPAAAGPVRPAGAVVPRLRLRPVRRQDLEVLERWWEAPEVQGRFNWFGYPPPGFLRRRFEENGMLGEEYGNLLVELEDGTLVGDVSYHAVRHGPGAGSVAYNVGITLLPEHRGRGLGAEAQRLLAEYLFAHTRVERVEAGTDVENVAEQRALEKAGFTREGVLRRAQFRDGAFHDMAQYSRLRGEGSGEPGTGAPVESGWSGEPGTGAPVESGWSGEPGTGAPVESGWSGEPGTGAPVESGWSGEPGTGAPAETGSDGVTPPGET